MNTNAGLTDNLPVKLVACALVVVCLILGTVGLVLPIIPGLLFLAIAAVIAARHFPSVERRLRRNRALNMHLDRADVFFHLNFWRKLQLGGLMCIKLLLDAIASIAAFVTKRVSSAAQR